MGRIRRTQSSRGALTLLVVRRSGLFVVFETLVLVFSVTDFTSELADAAANPLADVSYPRGAEQNDNYGKND